MHRFTLAIIYSCLLGCAGVNGAPASQAQYYYVSNAYQQNARNTGRALALGRPWYKSFIDSLFRTQGHIARGRGRG